jgi:DNA-binding NtrC family response regulator
MNREKVILIVDDDETDCEELEELISDLVEEKIICATNGSDAKKIIEKEEIAFAMLDYKLPDTTGIELLKLIKSRYADAPVIIITGFGTIESGVEAIKEGASDYILKPFQPEKILALIKELQSYSELKEENLALREERGIKYSMGHLIGKSIKIRNIYNLLPNLAQTDSTVLIQGESGTGKELLANAIHQNSPRKDMPFVVANCVALTESLLESELFGHEKGAFTGAIRRKMGRFEQAGSGTIFLDEIGDVSPTAQLKLLRVLQEKKIERVGGEDTIEVNVRIIAATNKNLEDKMKKGDFREDLYYRLNVIPIFMPPLRERKEDIPILAQYFLNKISKKHKKNIKGIDNEAYRLFIDYEWPGNIRELENALERAVVIAKGNMITKEELLLKVQEPTEDVLPDSNSLKGQEKNLIVQTLFECNNNLSKTARKLGISRSTLYAKIKKLKIKAN